jgi:asparagine synthase (glutamine-hydrolysing)
MCGIAGFAGKGTKEGLEKMITTLKHRGPDSQKTEFFGPVGLAHARLSIIDVSLAAAQPMCNPERTLWIVFNGEIYNFRTLRCSLEAAGYAFQTASDTEVLLQAYAVYGVEAFSLLEGMFALAIYDSSQGQVILARDRLGKKPLYWTVSDGTLVFGSKMVLKWIGSLLKKQYYLGPVSRA